MFPIIIDTGATITISPDHDDFGPRFARTEGNVLQGLATGLQMKGTGTIQCALHLGDGSEVELSLLTEVRNSAHFWGSHGRCAMPGICMGRLVGLSWQHPGNITHGTTSQVRLSCA